MAHEPITDVYYDVILAIARRALIVYGVYVLAIMREASEAGDALDYVSAVCVIVLVHVFTVGEAGF